MLLIITDYIWQIVKYLLYIFISTPCFLHDTLFVSRSVSKSRSTRLAIFVEGIRVGGNSTRFFEFTRAPEVRTEIKTRFT
jgi:hypothetical protein